MINEVFSISVPVKHFGLNDFVTEEMVSFKIFKEDAGFKAIPAMTKEERKITGLPEELVFIYNNHCIVAANNMEEETLDVIKQIILELQEQEMV